jgi:hypothetical protein
MVGGCYCYVHHSEMIELLRTWYFLFTYCTPDFKNGRTDAHHQSGWFFSRNRPIVMVVESRSVGMAVHVRNPCDTTVRLQFLPHFLTLAEMNIEESSPNTIEAIA